MAPGLPGGFPVSGAWEVVIGLEIHAQLATNSKIFSGASTAYGAEPNTQACLVDLGYPGVLPVLNEQVVRMAAKFGLAVNATVAERSVFARKNYFYPDLPKGYQISQYELPIVEHGELFITGDDGTEKRIGITRAHLEEDAGKSIHEGLDASSGIDLNRAGTPLLEIVSEPDLRSAKEAVAYMRKIHSIVRYLEISDGNMQEGSFRCDANVSVRPRGQEELGTRAELKNLNSFRFVERAINFEIERQIDLIEDGGEVVQETRLYDSEKDETRSMRSKEEANDYRYADYYEAVAAATAAKPQVAANWVIGDLSGALNKEGLDIEASRINAAELATLLDRIADNTISGKIAKEVFDAMWTGEGSADEIIEAKGLKQITDSSAIESVVDQVIAANPGQVAEYKAGKDKLIGFFVGQVMKETGGKANPGQVNAILKDKLS
jgi:aspartyl-tRNA(Asn)/glutamyl-tRNA(Gln) amidotransferase subunit B